METFYIILANLVVALHVGYVGFVVVGLLLILLGIIFRWSWVRNIWFRTAHLIAIGIVALETAIAYTCPLTTLENYLRDKAGQETLEGDFIGRMLNNLIFLDLPDTHWFFKVSNFSFFALVLLTFILAPPRRKKSSPAGGDGVQ